MASGPFRGTVAGDQRLRRNSAARAAIALGWRVARNQNVRGRAIALLLFASGAFCLGRFILATARTGTSFVDVPNERTSITHDEKFERGDVFACLHAVQSARRARSDRATVGALLLSAAEAAGLQMTGLETKKLDIQA